jgi:hypothetical protein
MVEMISLRRLVVRRSRTTVLDGVSLVAGIAVLALGLEASTLRRRTA